jgi:4,5-dihydroxyphthalate decarboxylase
MIRLTTAVGRYPATEALLDRVTTSPTFEPEFADYGPSIVSAFRHMIRESAYDVCELGATAYLPALEYGVPQLGLPIFPLRNFGFGSVMINERSGITSPGDLNGKRIAVRTYGVTAVVWVRAMLQELYGVDSSSITWVVNDLEHLAQFQLPSNVEYLEGADLSGMLESGEVAAGIGIYRGKAPDVVPLLADVEAVEREWYERTQVLPIHHLIVVRQELLEANPGLAGAIVDAFVDSKQRFLSRLSSGEPLDEASAVLAKRRELVGPDPVPYGIAANRRAIEALIGYSKDQQLLKGTWEPEEIFAPGSD